MKCQNCKNNEANFFYTQNINGRKMEAHLCEECARKLNLLDDFSSNFNFDFGFDRMFNDLFDDFGGLRLLEMPRLSLLNERNLLKEDYYDRGNSDLDNALDNITHKNKNLSSKEKLEKELKECIEKENYERAAEIRDELKKYKNS